MTKKKLKWRLSKLPTAKEVQELLDAKIISKEEARAIFFTEEDEKEQDFESLNSEIKFL